MIAGVKREREVDEDEDEGMSEALIDSLAEVDLNLEAAVCF